MKKLFIYLFILLSLFSLVACNGSNESEIIATSYIGYDFTRAIVKDTLNVKMITPAGTDFHHFEPTSKDLISIKKAEVFIYLGIEYDSWLNNEETLKTYVNKDALVISLSSFHVETEEEHTHEENHHDHVHGEHFWTDPMEAVHMIEALTESLIIKYPEHETTFNENSLSYINKLTLAVEAFENDLNEIQNKTIYYTGHMALEGFAEHFGLDIHALENTYQPGTDLTSEDLKAFVNEMKLNQIKFLFKEELATNNTAKTIETLLGYELTVYELHGYHTVTKTDFNQGITYHDLLLRNINYIKEALQNG
ncbi:metal ABC transporter substrate-binding protein [Acholeplasma hippikon]|uniref:Probable zinc transport system zinc-binding lipoprotein AdcA n=1 Tax=Acholeplasma hippikon TaxID=264636 RepID=A0A449BLE9_9MOLU|nr:metal ABC transporter substrate-binding protein [Acholeplasma hippikon]VEU83258.1 Probable zinc transport system zinc-binding lipoprotein AdcA precursor [Acholeplasma hippikon]